MKTTKTEKSLQFTTHKATTPAPAITRNVMLVTPALAAEWLKSNTNNRAVSDVAVRSLAEAITAGRWVTTHQGIAFDCDGVLIDGQHRLHAIVTAGLPVTIEVTSGLDRSAVDAIDNGGRGSRRVVDILRIKDGITLQNREVGGLTAAARILSTGTLMSSPRIGIFGLREARATHSVALAAVVDAMGRDGHHRVLGTAPVLGSLIITYAVEPKATVLFAEMLKTGENLSAGHPALALRNFLMTRPGVSGTEAREDVSLKTFAAFGAFAAGRPLHRLQQNTTARDHYVDAWRKANG
jgi:hypothetical protein